jgi:hypothetical protein
MNTDIQGMNKGLKDMLREAISCDPVFIRAHPCSSFSSLAASATEHASTYGNHALLALSLASGPRTIENLHLLDGKLQVGIA